MNRNSVQRSDCQNAALNQSNDKPVGENKGSSSKILIVDDDDKGRELTCLCLQSFGFEVADCRDGRTVMEKWEKIGDEIALVLTDVVMPGGVSGFELGEWIQSRSPHVNVIFSSGFSRHPFSGNYKLKEGVNFISKPFSLESLVSLIRRNLPGTIQE